MFSVRAVPIIAVYVVILIVLWTPIAGILANLLIVQRPMGKADAILVLSGSSSYIERTQEAARLFNLGVAPRVILTNDQMRGGWNENLQRNPTYSERARWELVRQGVPDAAIETLPPVVYGTDDEANAFAEAAPASGIKTLLLVTSPYHSRRALWTFDRAVARKNLGIEVGVSSPPRRDHIFFAFSWWVRRQGWRSIGLEYVKFAYYWAFY